MWANALFLRRLGTLFFLISAGLILYGAWGVIKASPAFSFHRVVIGGETFHVSEEMAKAATKTAIRGNFFGQRLEDIQQAFEKLPWVKEVSVKRVWPDTVQIDIIEHQPFARWGNSALLATDGALFQGATDAKLPVLYGPDGSQLELKKKLDEFVVLLVPLQLEVAQLELSNRYAWTMTLQSGEIIRLGREDRPGVVRQRLDAFAAAYPKLNRRYGENLSVVDMRYANGFSVTVKSSAANPATPAGSDTQLASNER